MEESKFISSIQKSVKFRDFDEEYLLSLNLPRGTKFLRVLIFTIFSAIRKNKFPQIEITANILPQKFTPE